MKTKQPYDGVGRPCCYRFCFHNASRSPSNRCYQTDVGSSTARTGATGSAGATGTAGTNGTNRVVGATGPKGDTGAAGTNGTNGTTGATGPAGAVGTVGAAVVTSETRANAAYGDLTTTGPSIAATINASGAAIVTVTMTASASVNTGFCYMSFAATGVAADDTRAVRRGGRNPGEAESYSATYYVTGLTAGSNTFTAKYRSDAAGTTCTFANRNIIVTPLP